jgi:hypothetical protein
MHWGRAWTGHTVEDNCPCPKAACGLVDGLYPGADFPECAQHNPRDPLAARTMRQAHRADKCPALAAEGSE